MFTGDIHNISEYNRINCVVNMQITLDKRCKYIYVFDIEILLFCKFVNIKFILYQKTHQWNYPIFHIFHTSITIVILFEIILLHTNLRQLNGNDLSPELTHLHTSNTNINCDFHYHWFTEFIFTCKSINDQSIHQIPEMTIYIS